MIVPVVVRGAQCLLIKPLKVNSLCWRLLLWQAYCCSCSIEHVCISKELVFQRTSEKCHCLGSLVYKWGLKNTWLTQCVKFCRIAFIEISIFGSNKPVKYAILPSRNLTVLDTFWAVKKSLNLNLEFRIWFHLLVRVILRRRLWLLSKKLSWVSTS